MVKVRKFPEISIVNIVEFDPWPFRLDRLHLAEDISYVNVDGSVVDSSPLNGWTLDRTDNRLAVLSDGTTAVLSADYDAPSTPLKATRK